MNPAPSGRSNQNEEDRLLQWLRRRIGQTGGAEAQPGDDAAVLPAAGETAVTVDSQISGVHFPTETDPKQVGRRLVAVNLSDLAAMGATPRYAFVALSSPQAFDRRRFFDGVLSACKEHQLVLAGGDLAHCPERVVATMTAIGGKHPRGRWLERRAARPGHALWVGGTLGESALGCLLLSLGAQHRGDRVELPTAIPDHLAPAARQAVMRHLEPQAQLPLGRILATAPWHGAAMDISDGLTLDLDRLCRESGVGAEIDAQLPLAPNTEELARLLGVEIESLALGGGEDYVLLFTVPPEVDDFASNPAAVGCQRIGKIIDEPGLWKRNNQHRHPLTPQGWDHLAVD